MLRKTVVPVDFLDRLGFPLAGGSGPQAYRAFQIAVALGVSEQSVQGWARQGRIPPGKKIDGIRVWSHDEMKEFKWKGVMPIGHYSPITKGERKRLTRAGRPVPRALRTPKKGGAK